MSYQVHRLHPALDAHLCFEIARNAVELGLDLEARRRDHVQQDCETALVPRGKVSFHSALVKGAILTLTTAEYDSYAV